MSLNRCEQRIYDYLLCHPEERHHWQGKFQSAANFFPDEHQVVERLEPELWSYFKERSGVTEPFKSAARLEGIQRTSMKNLAELLLRLWTEPKPRKKSGDAG